MNKTWNLKEMKKLIPLALPVLVVNLSIVGMGAVDAIVAGRAGVTDMAAVALGSSVYLPVALFACGVLMIIGPVIANMRGKSHESRVGYMTNHGLWLALMLSLVSMPVIYVLRNVFGWISDDVAMCQMASAYMFAIMWGLPGFMLFVNLRSFLEGFARTRPAMIIGLVGLAINVPCNVMFVYGKFGMPALGGAGCGVATAVVFWFNALVLWLYVAKQQYFRKFKLMDKFSKPDGRAFKQIWKLGMPIGLSFFLEVSLFSCIVFLVARLGEDYVAAQQVVISLTGVIYMIPQSVGAAGTVRVGYSLGRGEYVRARYVAGVSLVLGLLLAVLTALLLVLFRHPLAGMYTDDAGVLAIAATVLLFAAVFQLADATQCVASYALRGYKITRVPMLIHAVAFWGFGLLPGSLANLIALRMAGDRRIWWRFHVYSLPMLLWAAATGYGLLLILH